MSGCCSHASELVVLYAEDDTLIRWSLAEDLRNAGFRVIEAANAEEAIDIIASGAILHAVVTDINMPGEYDGREVAARAEKFLPHVPVIVTSTALPKDCYVTVFVAKPVLAAHLISVLQKEIGERWDCKVQRKSAF